MKPEMLMSLARWAQDAGMTYNRALRHAIAGEIPSAMKIEGHWFVFEKPKSSRHGKGGRPKTTRRT